MKDDMMEDNMKGDMKNTEMFEMDIDKVLESGAHQEWLL